MASITITEANVFLPNIWSPFILWARWAEYVMADLVLRQDEEVAAYGQAVLIPRISKISGGDIGPDGSFTTEAPTETNVTVSINKRKFAAVDITDEVRDQSKYNLQEKYGYVIGKTLAEFIEVDLLALYAGLNTNVQDITGNIVDSSMISAIASLDTNAVPHDSRYMIVSPGQKGAIMNIDKYYSAYIVGSQGKESPLTTGKFVREYYGVEIYMSPLVPRVSSKTQNMMFQKEAFCLAVQKKPKMETFRLKFSTTVASREQYGIGETRDDHAVLMRTTLA